MHVCSAPPVARWAATRDADDEYDDYDNPTVTAGPSSSQLPTGQWASPQPPGRGASGSQGDYTPPPGTVALRQQATPPPPPSSGKLRADELPVLVKCDDGEVILHFSEVFAPPRHELEK